MLIEYWVLGLDLRFIQTEKIDNELLLEPLSQISTNQKWSDNGRPVARRHPPRRELFVIDAESFAHKRYAHERHSLILLEGSCADDVGTARQVGTNPATPRSERYRYGTFQCALLRHNH